MTERSDSSFGRRLTRLHVLATTLKRMKRRGWVERGLTAAESVADHSFSVSLLALLSARHLGLSVEKAVTAALVHELNEVVTGDIIPADGLGPAEKRTREEEAAREVLSRVDESGELFERWLDFECQRTPEGRLVKELDRLEMALQARTYQEELGLDPSEFLDSAREGVSMPELLRILKGLERNR